jgi:hypothetical protein
MQGNAAVVSTTTTAADHRPEVESCSYTISPLVQYAMTCPSSQHGGCGTGAMPSVPSVPEQFNSLTPCKMRLAPPSGLGAIYSLHFDNHNSNSNSNNNNNSDHRRDKRSTAIRNKHNPLEI